MRTKPGTRPTAKPLASSALPIGRFAGCFGLRGELKLDPTDSGRGLFVAGAALDCERDGVHAVVQVESVRPHKGRLLVRLRDVDGADQAAAYVGATLYAPRDVLDVAPDEYLDADLIGCAVELLDGSAVGAVESVLHYPASDMLVVNGAMVPMVRAIVREVDLAHRRIVIDPPLDLL